MTALAVSPMHPEPSGGTQRLGTPTQLLVAAGTSCGEVQGLGFVLRPRGRQGGEPQDGSSTALPPVLLCREDQLVVTRLAITADVPLGLHGAPGESRGETEVIAVAFCDRVCAVVRRLEAGQQAGQWSHRRFACGPVAHTVPVVGLAADCSGALLSRTLPDSPEDFVSRVRCICICMYIYIYIYIYDMCIY